MTSLFGSRKFLYVAIAMWLISTAFVVLLVIKYQDAIETLEEAERVSAAQQSDLNYLGNSMYAVVKDLDARTASFETIEKICEQRGNAADPLICANIGQFSNRGYIEYLRPLLSGTAQLVNPSQKVLEAAIGQYDAASSVALNLPENFGFMKRLYAAEALGGAALVQFRLKRTDEARDTIDQAKALLVKDQEMTAIVALTDLKITCAQGQDIGNKKKDYHDLLSGKLRQAKEELEGLAANSYEGLRKSKENWIDYRKREFEMFESDPELASICS